MLSNHSCLKIMIALVLATTLAACGEQLTDLEYIQQAKEARDEAKLETEIIHLKNALRLSPDSIEARWLLGRAYLDAGDGASAEKELRRARELGMDTQALEVPIARSLLLQRKFQEIFDQFPLDLEVDSLAGREMLAIRGQAYTALGDLEQARPLFQRILEQDVGNEEAKLGLARLAIIEGNYPAAREQVAGVLQANPQHFDALLLLGGIEQAQQNYEAAIAQYRQALALIPGNLQADLALQEALFLSGEADQALTGVERILKNYSSSMTAQFLRARILFSRQEFDPAIDNLQTVLGVNPDHMHSHLMMGFIYFHKNNLNLAKDHLTRFVRYAPQHLPAIKVLADTQLRLNEAPETVFLLERVRSYAPDDAEILALLGSAYSRAGELAKANEMLEKAAALAPDSAAIKRELARGLIQAGETDEAVSLLEQMAGGENAGLQPDIWLSAIYFNEGNHSESLATATRAVERNPENPVSHNLLGFAWIENGDLVKAKASFEQALALDPNHIPALLNLGRLALSEQASDQAQNYYQRVLDLRNNHPRALLGMAEILSERQDHAAAMELIQTAWTESKSFTAGSGLLSYHLRRGEYEEVLQFGQEVDALYPNNPIVLNNLGQAKLALGDYANAITDLRRVANLRPESAADHHLLGLAHRLNGNLPAAEENLRKAMALGGDNIGSAVELAALLRVRGNPEGAEQVAADLINKYPDQAQGYHLSADLNRLARRYQEAADLYAKAQNIEPNEQRLVLASTAYLLADQGGKARTMLETWLAEHPDSAAAQFSLGSIAQKADEFDTAEKAYLKVIDLSPEDVLALNNLALLYLPRDSAKAKDYAKRAYDLEPNNPAIADTYGWVLLQSGEVKEGLRYLEQAAAVSNHPSIQYHLAVAYHEEGRSSEARRILQQVLQTQANFQERELALALLERTD